MNTLKHTLLTALLASLGCNAAVDDKPAAPTVTSPESAVRDVAAPTAAALWIEPGDRATNVADAPLRLGVRGDDAAVNTAALRALARGIHLETWPQRAPVDASVTLDPPREDGARDAVATVTASRPLAEGWYVLAVTGGAMALRAVEGASLAELGAGALGARFHVGSAPRAVAVRACDEGGVTRAFLELSEAVRDPAAAPDEKSPAATRDIALGEITHGASTVALRAGGDVDARWLTDAPAAVDLARARAWGSCRIVRF